MPIILPDKSVQETCTGLVTIEELLARFHINPGTVIVAKNGRIVPEDEIAGPEDEVRIIRVAHGG